MAKEKVDIIAMEEASTDLTKMQTGRGFENIDMEGVTMPRVKVLQPTSEELQDEDYDFKQGDLVHNLFMEKMPDKFVPITYWHSNILLLPRNADDRKRLAEHLKIDAEATGFIVCRASDGRVAEEGLYKGRKCASCPLCKFEGNNPPICTPTHNFLVLFEGQEMPAVLMFSNTNYKFGRRFRDTALFAGGDLFARKFKITPKRTQNEKGVFYTTPVKPAGKATKEEYRKAEHLYHMFKNTRIDTDVEDATMEPVSSEVEY